MSETVFSINGRIVSEADALIPVTDRGFLYGDGLFETMHAYGQAIFCLREHLQRLQRGARRIFFAPLPDIRQIQRWLSRSVAAAGFPEANVRLTVTRGCGPRGPSIPGTLRQNAVITVTRHQRHAQRPRQGARAIIASFRRQESAITARLKTLNYIEQILARREADAAGADEAILLNNAGLICEGSSSNIALVRNGEVAIPDPERAGALPGIAQLTALEAARRLKIPVRLTMLSPWDPACSDEAFLTGSMREITPLVLLGEQPIGSGRPGPITKKLLAEYRRMVEKECRPFRY